VRTKITKRGCSQTPGSRTSLELEAGFEVALDFKTQKVLELFFKMRRLRKVWNLARTNQASHGNRLKLTAPAFGYSFGSGIAL